MPSNIWNSIGIRTNPFFQEALDISPQSLRPIHLFVGRAQESEAVLKRILSADSSRIVIAGQPGAGKTTFIQYIKAQLAEKKQFAVASEYCRIPHDLSATMLGVEILRGVVRSLRNVLSKDQLKRLDGFKPAQKLVEETESQAWQVSVSVLGVGGGVGRDRRIEPSHFAPSQFNDALNGLARGALQEGVCGIVVHLNSLENLEEDPRRASVLLRDIRDYFLVPGIHYLLGATTEFHPVVLSPYAQVRSIFARPILLSPMVFLDVKELLKRRYEYLSIEGMRFTSPVKWGLVQELHAIFHGDLRGLFSALEEACQHGLGGFQSSSLDRKHALPYLSSLYKSEFNDALTKTELHHLNRLSEIGGEEFKQIDAAKYLGLSQGRVSTLISSLERAQAILRTRNEGRTQYYSLSGKVRLAFGKLG